MIRVKRRAIYYQRFYAIEKLFHFFILVENVLTMLNFKKVIIGMEPTGHYWKSLARYLQKIDWIHVVTVNPKKVKDAKELDDNCQTKNDKKDCMTISILIKDARFFEPYLPE